MVFYRLGCKPPGYHKWQTMFGFWDFFETVRFIDSQSVSLFGHGSEKNTPVEHFTLKI